MKKKLCFSCPSCLCQFTVSAKNRWRARVHDLFSNEMSALACISVVYIANNTRNVHNSHIPVYCCCLFKDHPLMHHIASDCQQHARTSHTHTAHNSVYVFYNNSEMCVCAIQLYSICVYALFGFMRTRNANKLRRIRWMGSEHDCRRYGRVTERQNGQTERERERHYSEVKWCTLHTLHFYFVHQSNMKSERMKKITCFLCI